ncbi:unnamed protein product [Trichobilharzia szidati]|nr:unnamed protein product [Trichobilharzia szidati]
MVFQRAELNLIILVSLCIFGIMKVESNRRWLPMKLDDEGKMTIDFSGTIFTKNRESTVTVSNNKCTWIVKMHKPNEHEQKEGRGHRDGHLTCKDWDGQNVTFSDATTDEMDTPDEYIPEYSADAQE